MALFQNRRSAAELDALVEYLPEAVIDRLLERRKAKRREAAEQAQQQQVGAAAAEPGGGAANEGEDSELSFDELVALSQPADLALDAFACRGVVNAPPRAAAVLSSLMLAPGRFLTRFSVVAQSGGWVGGLVGESCMRAGGREAPAGGCEAPEDAVLLLTSCTQPPFVSAASSPPSLQGAGAARAPPAAAPQACQLLYTCALCAAGEEMVLTVDLQLQESLQPKYRGLQVRRCQARWGAAPVCTQGEQRVLRPLAGGPGRAAHGARTQAGQVIDTCAACQQAGGKAGRASVARQACAALDAAPPRGRPSRGAPLAAANLILLRRSSKSGF